MTKKEIETQLSFDFLLGSARNTPCPPSCSTYASGDIGESKNALNPSETTCIPPTGSGNVIYLNKFRAGTSQNNMIQLYENILDSIKHIG